MCATSDPKVHIMLASYNGEQYIKEQTESILQQSYANFSLDIWDDQSSDSTGEIIEQISRTDSRVSHRLHTNRLGSAAANFLTACLKTSSRDAEYFAFCDQDDIWFPDKLSRAVLILESGNYQGYSAAVTATWEDGEARKLAQNSKLKEFDFLFEGAGQGCTFVFSRSLFEDLKLVLKNYPVECFSVHYHDWLVYLIARVKGKGWYFDQQSVMYYRQHESNDTGAKSSIGGVLARLKRLQSGWYADQVLKYCQIYMKVSGDEATLPRVLMQPPSFNRSICLVQPIFCGSRRRLSERVLLLMCIVLNWL